MNIKEIKDMMVKWQRVASKTSSHSSDSTQIRLIDGQSAPN